ncbi:hypothetical protein SAY87_001130 [Trapa incisa]|uniref:DUF4005 domain-containing protein n=1 Tax=Trapa incisa TaxID=236973 RepID=A0AAN7GSM4_9MYRT|nr:hypothetical protein SAY87_001130 [Trapa incisa]
MGRKGGWFSAVRKAFGAEPKEKKDQSSRKSKKKWLGKNKTTDLEVPSGEAPVAVYGQGIESVKLSEAKNGQSKQACNVALAAVAAAEAAAAAAAQAAAEIVRLTGAPRFMGKSKEEIAAIKIQAAFRGYMARRAVRALRGLVRLKTLVEKPSVKRQAASTIRYMQTMAHVQFQIRARRIKMSEENRALQRQLQRKNEKEFEKVKQIGEEWDDSTQSKEQIEANLVSKQEASIRRERALAYAYTHQQPWKNLAKSPNPTFMDPSNPHWGWSWLERWMAARPWENRHSSSRSYSPRDLSLDVRPSPSSASKSVRPLSHHQSPSTPHSKAPSISSVTGKAKPSSSRGSFWDDDSRSMFSVQSEHYKRRHSVAGVGGGSSSVRDDESLSSSASVPSYMVPTQSAKAKSRLPSPLGSNRTTPPEKEPMGSAKKRLSFTGSPTVAGMRRHSGPPKIDTSSVKGIRIPMANKVVKEEHR